MPKVVDDLNLEDRPSLSPAAGTGPAGTDLAGGAGPGPGRKADHSRRFLLRGPPGCLPRQPAGTGITCARVGPGRHLGGDVDPGGRRMRLPPLAPGRLVQVHVGGGRARARPARSEWSQVDRTQVRARPGHLRCSTSWPNSTIPSASASSRRTSSGLDVASSWARMRPSRSRTSANVRSLTGAHPFLADGQQPPAELLGQHRADDQDDRREQQRHAGKDRGDDERTSRPAPIARVQARRRERARSARSFARVAASRTEERSATRCWVGAPPAAIGLPAGHPTTRHSVGRTRAATAPQPLDRGLRRCDGPGGPPRRRRCLPRRRSR